GGPRPGTPAHRGRGGAGAAPQGPHRPGARRRLDGDAVRRHRAGAQHEDEVDRLLDDRPPLLRMLEVVEREVEHVPHDRGGHLLERPVVHAPAHPHPPPPPPPFAPPPPPPPPP